MATAAGSDDGRGDAAGLAGTKAMAALVSFALGVGGCWVAVVLERRRRGDAPDGRTAELLVFCNTVAAGVLIAASQVHMLPDAASALSGRSDFPIAGAVAGAAFVFLVVLGEAAISFSPRGGLLNDGASPSASAETGAHDHGAAALHHLRAAGGRPMAEVQAYMLFFALCFHSVMEGLGVGSAQDAGLLLSVIVAILAHKGLAAFALGCSLAHSALPPRTFRTFVLIFSSATPLGVLLGAVVAGIGDAAERSVANGICVAVAAGTFLQVATMEQLPRAMLGEKRRAAGCFGLMLGFGTMSLLAVWC